VQLDEATLGRAVESLGDLLKARGQSFDLAVIGGAALILLGLVQRTTADLDVVGIVRGERLESAAPLPDALADAVADVAHELGLDEKRLNNEPTAQLRLGMPEGFLQRTISRSHGGVTLRFASRLDQIHFKLNAAVDRWPSTKHFADLQQLRPNAEELRAAAQWVRSQERDPTVIDETLRVVLARFGVEHDAGA
jgi:hypothetical protein